MEEGLREEMEIKENVAFSREREKAGGRAPGLPPGRIWAWDDFQTRPVFAEETLLAGWNSRVI